MDGRTEKGRFAKGNPGGPGRKPRVVEEKYYDLLVSAISEEDWIDIVAKAVDQAKRGDGPARKFLGDYLMGQPTQRMEHTGADGGPIEFHAIKDRLVRKLVDGARTRQARKAAGKAQSR